MLHQETKGEFLGGNAEVLDAGESVEGTTGEVAVHTHLIEASHNVVAALVVAVAHFQHGRSAIYQSLDTGLLGRNGRADHGVRMHLHHLLDEFLRAAGIAQAQARHGKGLGETMQQQRALLHTRQRGDGSMLLLIIAQFGVNLICEHKQVILHANGSNRLQRLARSDGARRVRREIQHQHLGARGNGGLQLGWIQGKEVVNTRLHRLGGAVRHHHCGGIAHITGLVVQHLIPRVQQTAQRQVDSLTHTHGGQNLTQRVVLHMEEIRHILADSAAQALQAIVTGVGCVPLLQGGNSSLADIPRSHEIRLTDAQ